jgi:YbbR domain-containing protein
MAPDDGSARKPESKRDGSRLRGAWAALRGWLRGAVLDNAPIKFVSLVLAVTVFILVNTGQDVIIRPEVGVSYTMPTDRVLVSETVPTITLELRGSWRRTKRFVDSSLQRIHVDLRDRPDGLFAFTPDMIRVPPGLELLGIKPQTMRLEFEPMASKSVPIVVDTVGRPASGYRVGNLRPLPQMVSVRGAKSRIDELEELRTLPIVLDGKQASFIENVELVADKDVEIVGRSSVDVEVSLVEELAKRVVEGVAVAVRNADSRGPPLDAVETIPAEVTLILHGSQDALDEALEEPLFPYVTVTPAALDSAPADGLRLPVSLGVSGVGHEVVPTQVIVRRKPANTNEPNEPN